MTEEDKNFIRRETTRTSHPWKLCTVANFSPSTR